MQVYMRCRELNILLDVEWKRRSEPELELADFGSRGPWRLQENFTVDWDTAMEIIARRPEVNAFADRFTTLCSQYFSLNFEMEAEAKDFFEQSLSQDTKYYLHPHPDLLWQALKHLFTCKGQAVVLFHVWRTTVTYPYLVTNGTFLTVPWGSSGVTPTSYLGKVYTSLPSLAGGGFGR